jgi:hypothetical protein
LNISGSQVKDSLPTHSGNHDFVLVSGQLAEMLPDHKADDQYSPAEDADIELVGEL